MPEKKRIIIVTHRFFPIIGGAENQALLLAKTLALQGNQVYVLTSSLSGFPKGKQIIDGINIIRLNKYTIEKQNILFHLIFNFRILLYLVPRIFRFNCVLYFFAIDLFGLSAMPLRLLGKRTLIRTATPSVSEIGGNFKNVRFYAVRLRLVKVFCGFIAISNEIADNLLKKGIESKKIIRMNNGVDTSMFFPLGVMDKSKIRKELNLIDEKIYLLFSGHFYKIKGLDFLIDSLVLLGENEKYLNVELLIMGGSESISKNQSNLNEIMSKINNKKLPVTVNFLGQISDREKYFKAVDIFILPSQSEGMPNVLLEAMACGLACIATKVGGVIDVIHDGHNGILVTYGEKKMLGDAIKKLIENTEQRKILGIKANEFISKNYDIARVAKAYEEILL